MPLSWNEIKSRALTFSRTWADASQEDSQGKPFWIDFFEIFGITDKRVATFEHAVKKLPGLKAKTDGFVDLFWPGMLLVEQKSRGKNLDAALTQALSYFPGIAERDLPQIIIVCDFARFRVHRLATGETMEFELKDLHKHIKLFGFVAGYKTQEIKAARPRQHQGGRAHGPPARRPEGQRLHRPPAGSAAGAPAVLPVCRRHRHLSARRSLSHLH